MSIYCDESGGVGRGVMTLAAINIDESEAEGLIARFRTVTGYHGEVKGSRIDLAERALIFEMIKDAQAAITVGIAISALIPEKDADRGDHDIGVYAALLEDVVGSMLSEIPGCDSVIIDDGVTAPQLWERYAPTSQNLSAPAERRISTTAIDWQGCKLPM